MNGELETAIKRCAEESLLVQVHYGNPVTGMDCLWRDRDSVCGRLTVLPMGMVGLRAIPNEHRLHVVDQQHVVRITTRRGGAKVRDVLYTHPHYHLPGIVTNVDDTVYLDGAPLHKARNHHAAREMRHLLVDGFIPE